MLTSANDKLKWLPSQALKYYSLAPGCYHWLTDTGSTTKRFRHHSARFEVSVLSEQCARPTKEESAYLQVPSAQFAWLREVLLCCDEKAWMYARVVIPISTLRGYWRRLKYLKTKPLGPVLFQKNCAPRSSFDFALVDKNHRLYQSSAQHVSTLSPQLWARRSSFYVSTGPLLVQEVFLPDLMSYAAKI